MISPCSRYTQALFKQTSTGAFGKSPPIEVTSEEILHDAQLLIALRVAPPTSR
ncbi:hypothetical protein NRIC_27740 [Enterococcus florum]|uniref:Uncharacterized protein n=2 Tax=Enterococcus florum TaxID=2480627 RepID=A0A4P5PP16_9ENTE|nr:hypothetical protein NRIC_27740 [Enterococcus florum]